MMKWISVEDRLPNIFAGKFTVRLQNGIEVQAYFYQDAMAWIGFYGQKTGHWWAANRPNERLEVTHWLDK